MFDDIYADVAGDVTGSVSRKDDKGVTHTVKPAIAPTGSLTDTAGWLEAAKAGGSIADKGKTDNGANVQRGVKELSGKLTVKAMGRILGVDKPAKARTGKADTMTVEPSTNGTHS